MSFRIPAWTALLACGFPAALAPAGDIVLENRPVHLKPLTAKIAFVPTVTQAPTLDGKLDDAAWKDAAVLHEWSEYPGGAAADLDAEVRLVADRQFLYVAWKMTGTKKLTLQQPRPNKVDDYGGGVLEMFFDPNNDGKTKVQIVTNPVGLRYDEFSGDRKWNGTWKSVGVVGEDSWTLEAAIPAAELNTEFIGQKDYWKGNFGITYQDADGEHMFSWTSRWGDPAMDYGILYFAPRAKYEENLRASLHLYLDRFVYDPRDATAVALVRLDATHESLEKLSMRVVVQQGEKKVAQQQLAKLPASDVDLTLDMASLAAGEYVLAVDVMKGDKSIASAQRPFTKKERNVQPAAVTQGKIPVRVQPQTDLAGIAWPITTGVPFSQGSLASAQNVRLLDPQGKEVPCQTNVRSTWNRRGSVQWLGLDFQPTLTAEAQTYTLEYGPDVRATSATSLKVEETDKEIRVNTGPLQFTVDRQRFALISSASLNGTPVIQPQDGAGLVLVDHEGSRYFSALDRQAKVVVEEKGSVRTTICATGWYVKEGTDGARTSNALPTDRLCQFTVRLSAFAGSPLIKCAVSTTLTYDSTKVRLREITFGLPIPGAQQQRVGVGDQAIEWSGDGYVLQDRWDRTVDQAGKERGRADGWIEVRGPKADLLVGVRKFWQLFPKEIGTRNGLLTFHPWPAHGRDVFAMTEQTKLENIYKLWFAHQGKELDFRFPAEYKLALDEDQKAHPGETSPYYEAMSWSNAQGLTIHNDLVLALRATGDNKLNGDTLSKLANVEPHAVPEPAYTCATGVFGPMLHADPAFAQLEETYRRGFTHLTTRELPNNEYGMLTLGNMHTYWRYTDTPMKASVHRVWMNAHYQIARLPFIQYMRTGDPTWMGWGRDHANTIRDITTVNYVSDEKRFVYHQLGAMYHCKGFALWAGDASVASHPMSIDYLIYDYLINGNQRSRDVFNNWLVGVKNLSPGGYGTREGINPMSEIIEAYKLTWDPSLIEFIERFRAAVFGSPLTSQGWWDYNSMLLPRDYIFSGSEKTLDAYREAVKGTNQSYGSNSIYDGLLARYDNDPARLARWPALLHQDALSVINTPGQYGDGMTNIDWMGYAYSAIKYPFLLKTMKEAGLGIARPQATRPAPIVISSKRTLLAAQETSDQEIPVTIAARNAPTSTLKVKVYRADGALVAEGERPVIAKDIDNLPLKLTVPADGQVTDYLIVIDNAESYTQVLWPVTPLEREVAILPPATTTVVAAGDEGVRFYLAAPTQPVNVTIRSDSKPAMGMELLDGQGKVLAQTSTSRNLGGPRELVLPASAGPLSLYFSATATMLPSDAREPLFLSLSPETLFVPKITAAPTAAVKASPVQ